MNEPNWDRWYMGMADQVATKSKDKTKIGCVIVDDDHNVRTLGYNDFPRGVQDDIQQRRERPAKYAWTEHAERNAVFNAARIGVSVKDCTLYVPWFPCIDCARALIQAGIRQLVCFAPDFTDHRWGESHTVADEMLTEAGITIRHYTTPKA